MTMYEKIARMKPEQTNHWIDIPELSYWGERFFCRILRCRGIGSAGGNDPFGAGHR